MEEVISKSEKEFEKLGYKFFEYKEKSYIKWINMDCNILTFGNLQAVVQSYINIAIDDKNKKVAVYKRDIIPNNKLAITVNLSEIEKEVVKEYCKETKIDNYDITFYKEGEIQ